MIFDLTREIAALLSAIGMPYPVIYGPEADPPGRSETRIVVQRDRSGRDLVDAPVKASRNPRCYCVRYLALQVDFFARSRSAGAIEHEHEDLADEMVDRFLIAFHKAVSVRRSLYKIGDGHLLTDAEKRSSLIEHWPGVVYRQQMQVARAVLDIAWSERTMSVDAIDVVWDLGTPGGDVVSLPNATVDRSA